VIARAKQFAPFSNVRNVLCSFLSFFLSVLELFFYSGRFYLAELCKKESWASQEFGIAKAGSQSGVRKRLNFDENNLKLSWKL
jgi:hypothetical protein